MKWLHSFDSLFFYTGLLIWVLIAGVALCLLGFFIWAITHAAIKCIREERIVLFRNKGKGRGGYIIKSGRLLKSQISEANDDQKDTELYKEAVRHYANRKFGLCAYKQ